MKVKRRLVLLATALSALALPATAAADAEPNNALWQAEGPIAGGGDIIGTLPTGDDYDWYLFYAHPQQQLHLTWSTNAQDTYDCVSLHDRDGTELPEDYTTPPGSAQRYFVRVGRYCDGTSYRFRVDPGAAVTAGPAMPGLQQTGEPNESIDQAAGPLVGGTSYTGTIETSNDVEWFYFYTSPGTHQLDISSIGMRDDACDDGVTVALGDDEVKADRDGVSHIARTVSGAQRLEIVVNPSRYACVGAAWQFRIDPPGAVTSAPPTSAGLLPTADSAPAVVSSRCLKAKRVVRKYQRQVNKALKKLRRARGRSRKLWKHRLAVSTKRVKKARRRQRAVC